MRWAPAFTLRGEGVQVGGRDSRGVWKDRRGVQGVSVGTPLYTGQRPLALISMLRRRYRRGIPICRCLLRMLTRRILMLVLHMREKARGRAGEALRWSFSAHGPSSVLGPSRTGDLSILRPLRVLDDCYSPNKDLLFPFLTYRKRWTTHRRISPEALYQRQPLKSKRETSG